MAKASQAVILENEFYIIKAPNGKVLEVKNFNTENADSTLLRGIALRAGRNLQEKLFSLPADAPCAEAVDTADGSWKRTVSSKGAGGVTALCPVESRLYLGLAGSEKVRSANL